MKLIEATIDLPAEPAVVWQHLVDTASMASWNPFITSMAGVLAVGERIRVRIAPVGAKAMTFKPQVTVVQPDRCLEWLGTMGIPGLFDGRHSFTLTPLGQGRTRLVQAETFAGALIPFTGKILQKTEAGFKAMNTALLTRLELVSPRAPERAVTIDGPPIVTGEQPERSRRRQRPLGSDPDTTANRTEPAAP